MKKRNKLLSLLLASVLTVSALTPAAAAKTSELVTSNGKMSTISNDSVAIESKNGSVEVKPDALADDGQAEEVVGASEAVMEETAAADQTKGSTNEVVASSSLVYASDFASKTLGNGMTSLNQDTSEYTGDDVIYENGVTLNNYGLLYDAATITDDTYTVSFTAKLDAIPNDWGAVLWIGEKGYRDDFLALGNRGNENPDCVKVWGALGNNQRATIGDVVIEAGEKAHFVLVINGSNLILYKNGMEFLNKTIDYTPSSSNGLDIMFGCNRWTDPLMQGAVDDIRIYDESLTTEEVKALCKGIVIHAEETTVRVNETINLKAVVDSKYAQDTITWTSSDQNIAIVENGVVMGKSKGNVKITAALPNGAYDEIDIVVNSIRGKLIADFSFDDDATGFKGAGAVANKANSSDNLSIEQVEGRGGVLTLKGEHGNESLNYLDVKNEDGSCLLTGVDEFTVSYDVVGNGSFQNCWTFSADAEGTGWEYLAIQERNDINQIIADTNGKNNVIAKHREYAADEWKHVDVVYETSKTSIYVDGELVAQGDRTATVKEILGENSILYIGKSTNWGNEYFTGKLDNYKIYSYALTKNELNSMNPELNIQGSAVKSVKKGGSLTLELTKVGIKESTISWESEDSNIASVDNGIVTANGYGVTAVKVTADTQMGDKMSAAIKVRVTGQKIAEFTFDNMESGFSGAEAIANTHNITADNLVAREDGSGNVLDLKNGQKNWLDVTGTGSLSDVSLLAGLDEFTISYDCKSHGTWADCWPFYTSPDDAENSGGNNMYIAVADYAGGDWEGNKLIRVINKGSNAINYLNYDGLDTWKHIDVTFSGKNATLYIDGVKCDGPATMSASVSELLGDTNYTYIGKAPYGTGEYFTGQLDNYRIYDYALSDEELSLKDVSVKNSEGTAVVDTLVMNHRDKLQLTATVTEALAEADDITYEWSVDNEGIVNIDAQGNLEALEPGQVVVTLNVVYHGNTVTRKITVTVNKISVEKIEIQGTPTDAMVVGTTTMLYAKVTPADATDASVTWESSDKGVVTVDENGMIRAVASGSAMITATSVDDPAVTATENIEVSSNDEVNKFTVTVTNGTIGDGTETSKECVYGEKVTVKAENSEEGKQFAYWKDADETKVCYASTYTFTVIGDMNLTAVYSIEAAKKEIQLTCKGAYDGKLGKFIFTSDRTIPAEVYPEGGVTYGMLVVKAELGKAEDLTLDTQNVNVKSTKKTSTSMIGTYSLKVNSTGGIVYARAYIEYIDSAGTPQIIYSPVAEAKRELPPMQ